MTPTVTYAIITGAGSGIGRATAALLAGGDLLVIAVDRDPAGADARVDSIRRGGGQVRAVVVDVADGVNLSGVFHGTVATEWIDRILVNAEDPVSTRRAMEERQLDGRMGAPVGVAASIAFLAEPEVKLVNGSAFVMDVGMTAL